MNSTFPTRRNTPRSSLPTGGIFASLLLAAFLFAFPALAADQQAVPPGGGFKGPGLTAITVKEALSMRDDTKVVLRGNIVRSLGGENYLFRDATGTITVEVDDDIWMGQVIGPEDIVELHGEIDKDLFSTEVDVDRVIKQ